eukprot:4943458-Pyramimonas_sp.AAC.2
MERALARARLVAGVGAAAPGLRNSAGAGRVCRALGRGCAGCENRVSPGAFLPRASSGMRRALAALRAGAA